MSRHTSIAIAFFFVGGTAIALAQPDPLNFYASEDIPVANGGTLNDYTYTHVSDNQYEGITELRTGGAPHEKRTYLVHKWAIPVSAQYDSWAFHLEAHHTLTEGYGYDDFSFAWSPDDGSYYGLLTVTKTSDDDTEQVSRFYPPPTDTIYIRVTDTRPQGFQGSDTIYVDHMYIENYHDDVDPVIANVAAETVTGPAWVNLSPEVVAGVLQPRELHAMAYDCAADKTILFSGSNDVADTWAYDYTANTWDNRNPIVDSSSGTLDERVGHAMVYDSTADRIIMFGGFGGGHYDENGQWVDNWKHNDTWAYAYSINTWTKRAPNVVGGDLTGRWHHAMACDPVAARTIMVGGAIDGAWEVRETWVYDCGDNTWYNQTPTMTVVGGELPAISGQALAYVPSADPEQPNDGRIIMFGGWTPSGSTSDTWAYDCSTNTWYNMTPDMTILGGVLTPRARHAMVYEPTIGRIVMFGGQDESGEQLGDMWTYDYGLNTWQRLEPEVAGGTLSPREELAMVYDSTNSVTILFGGFQSDAPWFVGDTWMYTEEPTAVITWSTDELADSLVRYGTAAPPEDWVENATMYGSHSMVLRSLMTYPTYYYYEVQSTDVGNNTTIDNNGGAYYTFAIGAPNNAPDAPSNPSPPDEAGGVGLAVDLSVHVSDPDGDDMGVSFYGSYDAEPDVLIGRVYAVPSGTRANMLWEGLSPGTTYHWYAIADDLELSTPSATWQFATGSPGGVYVWDISWSTKQAGPNTFLTHTVTVRYDSDQDGVTEETDALVSDATVYSTLTHIASQESWNLSGVTVNGVVEFTQKVTASGQYEAQVTDISHGTHGYTSEMDMDNPDTFVVP